MAFNSKKVEKMLRDRRIKSKDYYAYVYPDRSGNSSMVDVARNTNPKAETIERIADLLQCSIDELFDRQPNYLNNSNNTINGDNNLLNINSDPEIMVVTINHLKDIISRQDQTIEDYKHQIDMLIDLVKNNR